LQAENERIDNFIATSQPEVGGATNMLHNDNFILFF